MDAVYMLPHCRATQVEGRTCQEGGAMCLSVIRVVGSGPAGWSPRSFHQECEAAICSPPPTPAALFPRSPHPAHTCRPAPPTHPPARPRPPFCRRWQRRPPPAPCPGRGASAWAAAGGCHRAGRRRTPPAPRGPRRAWVGWGAGGGVGGGRDERGGGGG